jgi:hypothetical protein
MTTTISSFLEETFHARNCDRASIPPPLATLGAGGSVSACWRCWPEALGCISSCTAACRNWRAATLAGLSAPVTVERDALGIPTIRGETRLDVARATGFVHAQERFFQMDLLRRTAAGELAELVRRGGAGGGSRQPPASLSPSCPSGIDDGADRRSGADRGLHRRRQRRTRCVIRPTVRIPAAADAPKPWRTGRYAAGGVRDVCGSARPTMARANRRAGCCMTGCRPNLPRFSIRPAPNGTRRLQGERLPSPAPPGPEAFDLRRQPVPDIDFSGCRAIAPTAGFRALSRPYPLTNPKPPAAATTGRSPAG